MLFSKSPPLRWLWVGLALNFSLSYYLTSTWTWNCYGDLGSDAGRGPKKEANAILRNFTASELSVYSGLGDAHHLPIYVSLQGIVFDVTAGKRLYQKGGAYHCFAGRDATRAFVTGCFAEPHLTRDLRGLSQAQLKMADQWLAYYQHHPSYHQVGWLTDTIDPSSPVPPATCQGALNQSPFIKLANQWIGDE